MDKKTKKILIMSIAGLIALRIFLLLLIPYFPHLEQYRISNLPDIKKYQYGDYFSAIHEGDDLTYYSMAQMIYKFDFKKDATMLGYPLMIIPFISIFGNNFSDIFFPLVIFNAIIIFSFSIILIVRLAFLIFKKIMPAIFTGFLFLAFPFVFYVFRNYGPQFKTGAWNDINFLNMHWLTVMTDPLTAFFTLLILFLMVFAAGKDFGLYFYFLIGFLAGFSAMIRITNVVIVLASALVIFIYEARKKYQKLFFCCLAALIAFSPQLMYNAFFFDSPASFGYQKEYNTSWNAAGAVRGPMWGFANFFHLFSRAADYSLLAIPAFLVIFGLALSGFLYIRKINKRHALIAALWFLLPSFIYMFFQTGQTAMRYYMPAVPAFLILLTAALSSVLDRLQTQFFRGKINQRN